jgi:hypothetical protein
MRPMADTEIVEQTAGTADGDGTPPGSPSPAPAAQSGLPTWARRSIIAVVLLSALAVAVWGAQSADSSGNEVVNDGAVISLFPVEGGQALRQTRVGAELTPGYDGRLTVNGIAIPEEQMEGARDPATVDPSDLEQNGLRPNNRNSVYFKPGPGKVIEEFDQGPVTISLRYFEDLQEDTARTVTWTIRVD